MKLMLIDDEPIALNDLKKEIKKILPESECAAFTAPYDAMIYLEKNRIDIVFLDIEMGNYNGIEIAKRLKNLQPAIQIIFVTGYSKYAVEAFAIHATGYLIKPILEEEIKRELTFVYGIDSYKQEKKIRVQTFGGFDIFVDGKLLVFKRSKSKELLAYLVDRRGNSVTTKEACAILFEDRPYGRGQKNYFQTILTELRASLRKAGIEDILHRSHNCLSIETEKLDCDFYRWLNGDPVALNQFRGEYMSSYSWAECTMGDLSNIYIRGLEL